MALALSPFGQFFTSSSISTYSWTARSEMTLREDVALFIKREIAWGDERRVQMTSKIAQCCARR